MSGEVDMNRIVNPVENAAQKAYEVDQKIDPMDSKHSVFGDIGDHYANVSLQNAAMHGSSTWKCLLALGKLDERLQNCELS